MYQSTQSDPKLYFILVPNSSIILQKNLETREPPLSWYAKRGFLISCIREMVYSGGGGIFLINLKVLFSRWHSVLEIHDLNLEISVHRCEITINNYYILTTMRKIGFIVISLTLYLFRLTPPNTLSKLWKIRWNLIVFKLWSVLREQPSMWHYILAS